MTSGLGWSGQLLWPHLPKRETFVSHFHFLLGYLIKRYLKYEFWKSSIKFFIIFKQKYLYCFIIKITLVFPKIRIDSEYLKEKKVFLSELFFKKNYRKC